MMQNCSDLKKSILTIPKHICYTSLHANLEIKKSSSKGNFVVIKENTDAFKILGVEEPIASIIFDPQEYQWRRFPSSYKR